jgi:hypothetical protein
MRVLRITYGDLARSGCDLDALSVVTAGSGLDPDESFTPFLFSAVSRIHYLFSTLDFSGKRECKESPCRSFDSALSLFS